MVVQEKKLWIIKPIFLAIIILFLPHNGFGLQKKLPDVCKKVGLEEIGFYVPLSVPLVVGRTYFESGDDLTYEELWGDFNGLYKILIKRFLLPGGYIKAEKEHPGDVGVRFYPTEKSKSFILTGGIDKYKRQFMVVVIANRKIKSIDYVNRWKLNGQEAWSFSFTYFLEPTFPGLPETGPWQGKATVVIDPSTGKWTCVAQNPQFNEALSSLSDYVFVNESLRGKTHGLQAYFDWIEKSYQAKPIRK